MVSARCPFPRCPQATLYAALAREHGYRFAHDTRAMVNDEVRWEQEPAGAALIREVFREANGARRDERVKLRGRQGELTEWLARQQRTTTAEGASHGRINEP